MESRLREEMRKANIAQGVYDSYFNVYLKAARGKIFEDFNNADATNSEFLIRLKQMSDALTAIENDLLTVIETGKLAKQQLENSNG